MKKVHVLLAIFFTSISYSQIIVINTGTSDDLLGISKYQQNVLVSGLKSYLGKCYGECNSVIPLNVPVFPNSNYRFMVNRPDTSVLYMTASSFQNLNLTYWKSVNGGYAWTKKYDITSPAIYSGVTQFFDTLNGISFHTNQKCLRTNNGFATCSQGTWPDTYIYGVEVFGDSTIIIGSSVVDCAIRISANRGQTWLGVGPPSGLGQCSPIDFEFLNKDTIFSVTNIADIYASFLVSINGGVTWKEYSFTGADLSAPIDACSRICIRKGNEVYLTARTRLDGNNYTGSGVILKTTDLGKTWSRFTTPFKETLYDMKFLNDSIALVCGTNGLLFKWNSRSAIFTGIKENDTKALPLNFYPNPVLDRLYLEIKNPETGIKVIVTNILGVTMYNTITSSSKNEIEFDKFPPGVYFVKIENAKNLRVLRVIKE